MFAGSFYELAYVFGRMGRNHPPTSHIKTQTFVDWQATV